MKQTMRTHIDRLMRNLDKLMDLLDDENTIQSQELVRELDCIRDELQEKFHSYGSRSVRRDAA